MLKITSIEPQKRNKNRFNIFLNGQFAFGLSEFALLENQLKLGKNLSEKEIAQILKKEELAKLTDLAANFLSFRPRSEKEVINYLTKKISQRENITFSQAKQSQLIDHVLAKLKKYQYLNDYEFAKWFLQSRLRTKPKGINQIKLELKSKGIKSEIIESVLDHNINEVELAKKALLKKLKSWQKLSPVEFKKKVYQFLASRGFRFDTISEIFAFFEKKR